MKQRAPKPGPSAAGDPPARAGSAPAIAPRRASPAFEAIPSLPPLGDRPTWSLEFMPRPPLATGPPIQRVGGPKFGLEVIGGGDATAAEGVRLLQAAQTQLKQEIRQRKADAQEVQEQAAAQAALIVDEGDRRAAQVAAQTAFTRELEAAEMTPAELVARAGADFALAAGVIRFRDTPIARVHQGAAAYQVSQAAVGPGFSAVYRRHSLEGLSRQEYVRDRGGDFLRRTAYRGITPPERDQLAQNQPLTPLNAHRRDTPELGFNFPHGQPVARGAEKGTDLDFLAGLVNRPLAAVPANREVHSYLQTRKGVGKYFSATSTPRAITSNHDAGFTDRGQITFDLARVPQANLLHTYKGPRFDANRINTAAGGHGNPPQRLARDVERGNETVLRNRELVLSAIPADAVTALDGDTRAAFEDAFNDTFAEVARQAYRGALEQSGLPFDGEVLTADPGLAAPVPLPLGLGTVQGTVAAGRAGGVEGTRAAAAVIRAAQVFIDRHAARYREGFADEYFAAAVAAGDYEAQAPDSPKPPPPATIPAEDEQAALLDDAYALGEAAGRAAYNRSQSGDEADETGSQSDEDERVSSAPTPKGKKGKQATGKVVKRGKGGKGGKGGQ